MFNECPHILADRVQMQINDVEIFTNATKPTKQNREDGENEDEDRPLTS